MLTEAAQQALADGRPLAEVLAALPGLPAHLTGELAQLCDPARYTGAAAALVDRALQP